MGILRRNQQNTQPAEEAGPTFGLTRPNVYSDLAGNLVLPDRSPLPPMSAHQVTLDVDHPARQGVIMHTSAVDRSKGFQIAITPISIVLAILAVIVSLAFDNDLLTFTSLVVFWITFAVVYVVGWALTAVMSAEFVSLFSAWRQWNTIDREQAERWQHYRGQAGPVVRPWWIEFKGLIYAGALLGIVGFIVVVLWAMLLWG
jgi:hypothetical protein